LNTKNKKTLNPNGPKIRGAYNSSKVAINYQNLHFLQVLIIIKNYSFKPSLTKLSKLACKYKKFVNLKMKDSGINFGKITHGNMAMVYIYPLPIA
jgi:hypothetical protein